MDNRSKFILAKFGKKEHLEQLKEGNIFLMQFRRIEMMGRIIEEIKWKDVFL